MKKNLTIKKNHIRPISTSTDAATTPSTPVKVFNNADTQRLELLNFCRGTSAIYLWTNKFNGKRYVGSAKDLRLRLLSYYNTSSLLNTNMLICKALLKYGFSAFSLTILECCKTEELVQREQYYIDTLRPEYNILTTAYSSLGYTHTEETLAKISKENNHMFGQNHTEEARAKMVAAKLGRVLSEELKEKLKVAATGKIFTEEHRLALSASKKNNQKVSVLDLQTGTDAIYNSINEAARLLNIPSDSIRANMRSKSKKPYKGQYIFKKLD